MGVHRPGRSVPLRRRGDGIDPVVELSPSVIAIKQDGKTPAFQTWAFFVRCENGFGYLFHNIFYRIPAWLSGIIDLGKISLLKQIVRVSCEYWWLDPYKSISPHHDEQEFRDYDHITIRGFDSLLTIRIIRGRLVSELCQST
jgi:hypothetical protein